MLSNKSLVFGLTGLNVVQLKSQPTEKICVELKFVLKIVHIVCSAREETLFHIIVYSNDPSLDT